MSELQPLSRRGPQDNVLAAAPASRVSLGDIVAERLREAILEEKLEPGQHVREEEVSASMAVSRGPVRDAFLMLEREGLLQLSRHRGATVVKLSFNDLGEVYSLRSAIETLAIRLAVRRHDEADLAALDQAVADLRKASRSRMTESQAARLDVAFHDAIFQAAHHDRLYRSWSTIRMQVFWFLLSRNVAGPEWRKETAQKHAEIADIIRAGSESKAATLIGEHIRGAYERIREHLQAEAGAEAGEFDLDASGSFLLD